MRKWIGKPSPKSLRKGTGWFGELNKAWVDESLQYCVMSREIKTEWGNVDHVCMRNATETDIPWMEKQRIKDELFGYDRTAIEVYPTEPELIDEANMYHLWVLPKGFKMPFTLKEMTV
ncbi:hypothetical protein [Paenibacillus sp. L3-i20]|uniref:DUF7694 domain-containing protein n=1 Tax=Paenibacillus sp. L3-i20 TaxID=2905833 RepID=UPI001EDDA847|nr:hypothetical protein [Paenibacillus sp. L3-i20]GKU76877.1 hypothetical protein L3i20_v212740 [Paenibacillus sp. L3-i20]